MFFAGDLDYQSPQKQLIYILWLKLFMSCFQREMQKELHRVTELEIKNEQQQKLLRRKNEEIASAKRRLRHGSAGTLPPING